MNKNDSERLVFLLERMGGVLTGCAEEADLILMNTCSVRQSAEDRIYGHMRTFMRLKEKNPKLIIGVTGCMAGRDQDGKLRASLRGADLFFATKDMVHLPQWIAELRPDLAWEGEALLDYLSLSPIASEPFRAYVTIQTGCNNFCSYCVVPFSRGREHNRLLSDILMEVRQRALEGAVEIVLLGQTVNSYVASDPEHFSPQNPFFHPFAALLWEINQIPGVLRLHFTAPHPKYMHEEVVEAMTLPAHLPYLHLPIQSGSDEVLQRMNRKHTVADYLCTFESIKKKIPGIALGTDIIVGFCGETQEQFLQTVDVYKQVDFDIAYLARYSPRSGTVAWRAFKDDVSREEKKERWKILQSLMEDISWRKNQAFVGQEVSVLVERCEQHQGMPYGYGNSRELKLTRFPCSADLVGKIVRVKITRADTWLLEGERIESL
jgi:tRNA-2-methylthio-N6-dimethylallyladenosine synthase